MKKAWLNKKGLACMKKGPDCMKKCSDCMKKGPDWIKRALTWLQKAMEKLFSKTESKYLSTLFQKEKKLETDVCISENSLFEIHKFPLSPVEISTRGYRKTSSP